VIPRVFLLLLVFTFLFPPFVSACRRTPPHSNITFNYEVTPQPPHVGATTIDLQLRDAKGQAVSGAHVETEGNMSHAGMSPVSGVAREIEAGKYRVTLPLTMAGDWIIVINATLANGEHVQHQIELNGVRSN